MKPLYTFHAENDHLWNRAPLANCTAVYMRREVDILLGELQIREQQATATIQAQRRKIEQYEEALRWVLDNHAMVDRGNDCLATPSFVDVFEKLHVPDDIYAVLKPLVDVDADQSSAGES